jgi:hypothetical protein
MSSTLTYWLLGGLIVIVATILAVWLRHNFKVKKVTFKTGLFETELERNDSTSEKSNDSAAINVSGNKMIGWNRIFVRREKTNVSDNSMVGENEIEVGSKPGPKPKRKKGIDHK